MSISKNDFRIPQAIILCLDDVGWHNGEDLRPEGMASRSGLPRYHHPLDYKMLAELGKAIDMKIVCPLCLGDWDKDNILRGEVGMTHKPHTWDRASEIDLEYTKACFDELESAEYIEYAIHGILHGRYGEDGSLIWELEHFEPIMVDGKMIPSLDTEDFKHRIDVFFKLYDMWGFSQKPKIYVAPCGVPRNSDEEKIISGVTAELEKRGVKYWMNGGFTFEGPLRKARDIAIMRKMGADVPWNAYDFDPKRKVPYGADGKPIASNALGWHWTNFIRFNPENNLDRLSDWVDFFKRQADVFGAMLAKDTAFSANQQFYHLFADVALEDNKCIIDLKKTQEMKNVKGNDTFYISFKNGLVPVSCEGGTIELYEKHTDFVNYKVTHHTDKVIISF